MTKPAVIISTFLFATSIAICTESKKLSLLDAKKEGLVTVNTTGVGGYTGQCIIMEITVIGKKEIEIVIDAGLKLIPEDSAVQSMIVTQDKILALAPKAVRKIKLYAMCTESSDMSPPDGSTFAMGPMADGNLMEVVKFISAKKYQADAAQQAIWCITDSASIGGIQDDANPALAKELRMFVAKLTGKIPPWYQIEYKQETGTVFTNEPAVIKADFQYTLKEEGTVTFAIYNEKGEMVQTLVENHKEKPGLGTMKIRFETREFKKGKYFVRVTNNGVLIEEKVFEL